MVIDGQTGNRLLDSLSQDERDRFSPHLTLVSLSSGEVIYEPHRQIERIYFPTNCVLSILTLLQDGTAVEIGSTGREGFAASQVMLGARTMPNQTLCQVPGEAVWMPLAVFEKAVRESSRMRRLAERYAEAMYNFVAQSVACNRLHTLIERCARWLLLTHDRVDGDEFSLTQEFLAIMLGVRRPGVSVAAGTLQEAGFITYHRGRITVRDRVGLESAACECYALGARDFDAAARG